MKSGIAGVLIVLGLVCIIGSFFVGNNVSAGEEWTEDKTEEFSQITASLHVPTRGREQAAEREAKIAKLKEFQDELISAKEASSGKKAMLMWPGVGLATLGVCFQMWDWASRKKK